MIEWRRRDRHHVAAAPFTPHELRQSSNSVPGMAGPPLAVFKVPVVRFKRTFVAFCCVASGIHPSGDGLTGMTFGKARQSSLLPFPAFPHNRSHFRMDIIPLKLGSADPVF